MKNREVRKISIRSQMVAMFLTVILPLFVAGVFLIVNMRASSKESALNSALNTADNIKFRLDDIMESTETVVENFSVSNEMLEFLMNDYSDKSQYYEYYSKFSTDRYTVMSPQIEKLMVYVTRDDFVYSSNYLYADENITSQEWFEHAIQNEDRVVWNVVKSPADDKYYLSCLKAITDNRRVYGVIAALISNEWADKIINNEGFMAVLSVGRGNVYFSNYDGIIPGETINMDGDFRVSAIRKTYDYGFFDYKGYTVLENFYSGNTFQIVLLLPSHYVNYELNRLSVIYGGYCGLMIILSLLIILLFTSVFSRRIKLLSSKMHAVAGGNFDVEFNDKGNDEIADLYSDLGQMISDMRSMMNDVYQAEIQSETFKFNQMEAEFKALASQINPHFLYNTLETIRMKAYCNNDKETADLVKKLGKFMRRCLEFKDGDVTLRSELEFTNSYLELQSARFGDRISYSIYSEVSKNYMILPLIIQPLVENAFVHGIEGSKSNGRIDIRVYYSNEYVLIDVTDNGQGMSEEKLRELEEKLEISDTSSGKSIGLTNVHKRIKMYHGEKYGMSIKSKLGEGTTIRVTLPREPVSEPFQKALLRSKLKETPTQN